MDNSGFQFHNDSWFLVTSSNRMVVSTVSCLDQFENSPVQLHLRQVHPRSEQPRSTCPPGVANGICIYQLGQKHIGWQWDELKECENCFFFFNQRWEHQWFWVQVLYLSVSVQFLHPTLIRRTKAVWRTIPCQKAVWLPWYYQATSFSFIRSSTATAGLSINPGIWSFPSGDGSLARTWTISRRPVRDLAVRGTSLEP